MSDKNSSGGETGPASASPPKTTGTKKVGKPDWAHGLRQLYESVVEEPLPDSFRELLSRLDK